MMKIATITAALALLSACASKQDVSLERALSGQSQKSGSALDRAIAEAAKHPFGSMKNPVRAEMPPGQHAYLGRLRCSDGRAPKFDRMGSYGIGAYGNIIDRYSVDCGSAAPGSVEIFMDMYHRGYVENRPVPGFTIVP
jgi:hypothetical protein